MRRWVVALMLLAGSTGIAAQPVPVAAQKTVFKAATDVSAVDLDDPREILVRLWNSLLVLAVNKPSKAELKALSEVIQAASDANRAALFTFDSTSSRIDATSLRIVYSLCTASLDELVFRSRHSCVEGGQAQASARWQQALAVAVAEADVGDHARGRDLLDTLLTRGDLSVPARTIALQARIGALESIGENFAVASPMADEAFFAALKDSRALMMLRPDDKGPAINVARLLSNLGDYDGAALTYRDVIKRWPEEAGNSGVSLAVVARQKGDFEQSLTLLNGVSADHGDDLGMRYYYHRGWTLLMLERFDEAIASFNEGMKTQADYAWAFIKRGCAQASVGRIAMASDDFDHGVMLMTRFAPDAPNRSFTANLSKTVAIRDVLSAAKADTASIPHLCDGFPGLGDQRRAKSKLLD